MQNIETMIAEVSKLDAEIFTLEQSIADKKAGLVSKRDEVKKLLDAEIAKEAALQLQGKDYGCGTANIETAAHKVKVTVSKKVKWDEKQLFGIRQQIVEGGQDPALYIKEKLSVSETAYKNFPDNIQAVFEPARTVEPSVPKIEIVSK